jgi:hypothetical protein
MPLWPCNHVAVRTEAGGAHADIGKILRGKIGPADQHGIALLGDEAAAGEVVQGGPQPASHVDQDDRPPFTKSSKNSDTGSTPETSR